MKSKDCKGWLLDYWDWLTKKVNRWMATAKRWILKPYGQDCTEKAEWLLWAQMALASLAAISAPKIASIFRAHPFQWPSKCIFPHQYHYVPHHLNNRYITSSTVPFLMTRNGGWDPPRSCLPRLTDRLHISVWYITFPCDSEWGLRSSSKLPSTK